MRRSGVFKGKMVVSRGAERVVAILEAFSEDKPRLTFKSLQEKVGAPASSLQRVLNSLENAGYVVRPGKDRTYELGIRVLGRGRVAVAQQGFDVEISRDLITLSERTEASANLAVLQNGRCYLLARIPKIGEHDLRNYAGREYPVGETAMGMALIAFASERAKREVWAQFGDKVGLLLGKRLEETRKVGYAVDRGGWSSDIFALAAPIRKAGGLAVGAVGVADLLSKVDEHREQYLLEEVFKVARQASARRGYDIGI